MSDSINAKAAIIPGTYIPRTSMSAYSPRSSLDSEKTLQKSSGETSRRSSIVDKVKTKLHSNRDTSKTETRKPHPKSVDAVPMYECLALAASLK